MTADKATAVPADKLRLYQRLLDSVDGVEVKSNFGSAYTAVNGNMYSIISKYGVVGIRLRSQTGWRSWRSTGPQFSGRILLGRRRRSTWLCLTIFWPTRML